MRARSNKLRCNVCSSAANVKCSQCHTLYCSDKCQEIDWQMGHNTYCLIEGKRKKEEDSSSDTDIVKKEKKKDICDDDIDPISLDEFDGMPPEQIIILDRKCFHLPSLYNWVINDGNNRNPLTNVPFTPEQLVYLQETAIERYPLTITFRTTVNQDTWKFRTTSLTSCEQLVMSALDYPPGENRRVDSLFQTFRTLRRLNMEYYFKINVDFTSSARLILDHGNAQLIDIHNSRKMVVVMKSELNIHTQNRILFYHMSLARLKGWPMNELRDNIREAERALRLDERYQAALNAARNQNFQPRVAEADQIQPENTHMMHATVNTVAGRAYGALRIFVPLDATFADVEAAVRQRADEIFPLPDREFRFIYAGTYYPRQTRVTDLPRFQEGINVYLFV